MKETLINTNRIHQKTLSKMLQKARYKGLSVSKLEEVIDKTEKGFADYRIIYDTILDENMENSSDYLGKVKEFMTAFGQPVLDKPTPLPEDRQKLRIALLFEELKEYAEASGYLHHFNELSNKSLLESGFSTSLDKIDFIDNEPAINEAEQLDALLDLQYVLSGAVHEHGFGGIFDAAFEEVHSSNMSKACSDIETAIRTIAKYDAEGVEVYCDTNSLPIVIYRKEDNKVLKSIDDYKPAQLVQFLK